MRVRIESALARRFNESLEDGEERRMEVWEGDLDQDMNLEEIFRFFNRVDYDDGERLERLGYLMPSLSVDDLVTKNGKTYRVEPVGFVEVSA
jgi:hypothetical protein